MFTRLETHLKNNAFCKSIPQYEPPDQCSAPNNHQAPALSSIHTLATAQQLPPTASLEQPPTTAQQLTTVQDISQDLSQPTGASSKSRGILNLPSDPQEWNEANKFMREQLIPNVLASSPDTKNRILSEGIYDYFDQRYGTRQPKPSKHQRRRARQNKALKNLKELKNAARRDFQKAKKEGLPSESIQPLAKKFFQLIREHNRLKKVIISQ